MRRLLILFAVLLVGLAAGRITAPAEPAPPEPPTAGSPGPTRTGAGGVGTGYAHSRAGAIAASATYQQAFADPAILRGEGLRRRVDDVATPEFAPVMLEANRPGAKRLREGLLGEGLRAKTPTAYFGVPAFYRVLSYSRRRAVIRTWGFTVVGNAETIEPGAYFGVSRMELIWSEGDWKIADTEASFGPTPRLVTSRRGGEGFALIDMLAGMKAYAMGR